MSTGNIRAKNNTFGSLALSVTTGNVNVSGANCKGGKCEITTSTDDIRMTVNKP